MEARRGLGTMMVSPQQYLSDENWDEVAMINSHAMLMGYLTMAIKGLGFLVLTWTTVVLLGGLVSMLHKHDFWCLAFITLVQTAGVFDAVLNEKLGYIGNAVIALLRDGVLGVMGGVKLGNGPLLEQKMLALTVIARLSLALTLLLVQVLVLVAVLCPLAIIYLLGILMSGGISLWRLIEHDYSNTDSNEEASNLAPAMDTLYYLALLQCVLFCLRFVLRLVQERLAKEVANTDDCNCPDVQVVSNYLSETRRGCEKDPSFAKGRNIITVAVEKIGSDSLVECISGVKMLYTSINIAEKKQQQGIIINGQRLLMNYLVLSASSSRNVLQKLLDTLDSRGIHDRETRKQATVIVERLALNINLEEFPRGIQHIVSLIDMLEECNIAQPYQRGSDGCGTLTPSLAYCDYPVVDYEKDYRFPLVRGLNILTRLAVDENNCRVMSNTQDLISKIMAPVTSDLLHQTTNHHGAWSIVVDGSIQVMSQLIRAQGETGAKLCREISSYEEAISSLWRIIHCNECNEVRKQVSLWILARLYYNTESIRSTCFVFPKKETSNNIKKEDIVMMLVDIFIHDNKYSSSTRVGAGISLLWVCFYGGTHDVATIVIQTCGGDVVDSLAKVLAQDQNEMCRQLAAEIFENICTHYIKDDECPGKLKKALTDAIPEMFGEIIRCADRTNTGKEAHHDTLVNPNSDIENQCGGTREKSEMYMDGKEFEAVMRPIGSWKLLSCLLSLCATVYDTTFIGDLPPQVDAYSFLTKLQEVVARKTASTGENLLLCKAACKMVISIMKYSGRRIFKQEDLWNLRGALALASMIMLDLDHSMVFRSVDRFEFTWSKLNRPTLASLVKEAKERHAMVLSTSTSG